MGSRQWTVDRRQWTMGSVQWAITVGSGQWTIRFGLATFVTFTNYSLQFVSKYSLEAKIHFRSEFISHVK